ncbi:MAG: histidine phosphatase family protein [Patescibacteria group bacterium]
MKIFFARHGQTTGDMENRYGGDFDDHMTPNGRQQALELAKKLADKGIQAILTSPLIRARETAEIISRHIGSPIFIEPALKERNWYGVLTGMTKEEAARKFPRAVEELKDRNNTIPGGESYADFSARVQGIIKRLGSDTEYNCIAVVSHGGPAKVLFRDILKAGEIHIGDCGLVELEANGSGLIVKEMDGVKIVS